MEKKRKEGLFFIFFMSAQGGLEMAWKNKDLVINKKISS